MLYDRICLFHVEGEEDDIEDKDERSVKTESQNEDKDENGIETESEKDEDAMEDKDESCIKTEDKRAAATSHNKGAPIPLLTTRTPKSTFLLTKPSTSSWIVISTPQKLKLRPSCSALGFEAKRDAIGADVEASMGFETFITHKNSAQLTESPVLNEVKNP